MFGQPNTTQQMMANPDTSRNRLLDQQYHPFQPHMPTNNVTADSLPLYQSIKKSLPSISQDQVNFELQKNVMNNVSFPNNNFNHPQYPSPFQPQTLTPPQQSYANQPLNPMTYSPQPLQGTIPSDLVQYSGTIYYNQIAHVNCQKLSTTVILPKQKHICVLILNLVALVAGIGSFFVIYKFKLQIWMLGQMFGLPYVLYLVLGLCLNNMRSVIGNIKPYGDIEKAYNMLKNAQGQITFIAEFYHYGGGRHRRRVVTKTVTQKFPIRSCIDESQSFDQVKQGYKFLFGSLSKSFCFADQGSRVQFMTAFQYFKNNNKGDTHQTYKHVLDIVVPGFQQPFALTTAGDGACIKPLYYLSFFLLMGYPFLMLMQCMGRRFQVNSVKRLAV